MPDMAFVLDASVTACWAFHDEDHATARFALERAGLETVLVPAIWWFEVRNVLIVNERRGRLTASATSAFLEQLERLGIVADDRPSESAVLGLARRHRLSVHDSSYLELARRESVAITTLDRALAQAASAEGVAVLGPSG